MMPTWATWPAFGGSSMAGPFLAPWWSSQTQTRVGIGPHALLASLGHHDPVARLSKFVAYESNILRSLVAETRSRQFSPPAHADAPRSVPRKVATP
jgi:hypothetical protein